MTSKVYVDDAGVEITTHSMLKQFNKCPKATQYKYVERLKKKVANKRDRPLKRGTWMHVLLQEYYAGRDWKEMHARLTAQFNELFDEEKDALGDLPRECAMLMRSYLWHYGANKHDPFHGWEILDVEKTLECPWPDGRGVYRGRVDLLVKDEYGLWIVDHKTHARLPGLMFRLLDFQSILYIWAAWEMGIPVQGFIWNYLRTKAPTVPSLAYAGTSRERLSLQAIDTDYVTYYLGIKRLGRLADPVAKAKLHELKSQRWMPGDVQTSPFFRRETLEKDDEMVARAVGSAMRTRDRMHDYDWGGATPHGDNYIRETVERAVDRHCEWCDYNVLCSTELFGGNARVIRRNDYRVGDPLEYYQEIKDVEALNV